MGAGGSLGGRQARAIAGLPSPPARAKTNGADSCLLSGMAHHKTRFRVLASGATELWTATARQGNRLSALGDAALEAERPLHVAVEGKDHTVCGESTRYMREYPVEFAAQEQRIRCPACDQHLGHPVA